MKYQACSASFKVIPLSTIRLPGDFGKRLDATHVAERAKSILEHGLLHEPIVRRVGKQWEVIAGLDRVAAHFVAEKDIIAVKVIECTDEEAVRIRQEENIQRRHSTEERDRLIRERLSVVVVEEEAKPAERPKGRGAVKKPKTKARERVAAELGLSPETIRKKEWEDEQAATAANLPLEPPVRSLGMSLSEKFKEQVGKAQGYIDAAEAFLRQAQGKLTAMAKDAGVIFPTARLQRLRDELHTQAAAIRGARPCSLCPWCKGLDNVQEHCAACQGTGFITKSQENAVPKELLDEETPSVMVDGKLRSVDEFIPEINAIADLPPEEDPWGLDA